MKKKNDECTLWTHAQPPIQTGGICTQYEKVCPMTIYFWSFFISVWFRWESTEKEKEHVLTPQSFQIFQFMRSEFEWYKASESNNDNNDNSNNFNAVQCN